MTRDVTPESEGDNSGELLGDGIDPEITREPTGRQRESAQESGRWLRFVRKTNSLVWPLVRDLAITLKNLVVNRGSDSLITYGAYLLRCAGLIVGTLGFFAPVIEAGSAGVVGWLVDLFVNATVGFALFVVAEIALTVREMSESLKSFSDRGDGGTAATPENESRSEGY